MVPAPQTLAILPQRSPGELVNHRSLACSYQRFLFGMSGTGPGNLPFHQVPRQATEASGLGISMDLVFRLKLNTEFLAKGKWDMNNPKHIVAL